MSDLDLTEKMREAAYVVDAGGFCPLVLSADTAAQIADSHYQPIIDALEQQVDAAMQMCAERDARIAELEALLHAYQAADERSLDRIDRLKNRIAELEAERDTWKIRAEGWANAARILTAELENPTNKENK